MEFVKLFGPTLVAGLLTWLGIYIKATLDERSASRAAEARLEAGAARIEMIRSWLEVHNMATKVGASIALPATIGDDLVAAYSEAKLPPSPRAPGRASVWRTVADVVGPPRALHGFWAQVWRFLYWLAVASGALITLALIGTIWDSTYDPKQSWLFNFTTAAAASAVIFAGFVVFPLWLFRRLALLAAAKASMRQLASDA